MSIIFSVNSESGYFISKYIGKVTTKEIIDLYTAFFEGKDWAPELNELVDHSELDGSMLTRDCIENIAKFSKSFYEMHNISTVNTAIFAPNDLPFGLSRMYHAMTYDTPEQVGVFRSMQEAKSWLDIKHNDRN